MSTQQQLDALLSSLGFERQQDGWSWTGSSSWRQLYVWAEVYAHRDWSRADTCALTIERLYLDPLAGVQIVHRRAEEWLTENVFPCAKPWCEREHRRQCASTGHCDGDACSTTLPNANSGGAIRVRAQDAVALASNWIPREIWWARAYRPYGRGVRPSGESA
ncbi:hypothetical protein [Mycobacteroides abscessus]|uniref:hypothetical protein n=1 Tax=Mycobacteroides abscessus TaxID=36809 RepID=UPI000C26A801|nr:hypothetical protein [Mycobacteroides abscessus]